MSGIALLMPWPIVTTPCHGQTRLENGDCTKRSEQSERRRDCPRFPTSSFPPQRPRPQRILNCQLSVLDFAISQGPTRAPTPGPQTPNPRPQYTAPPGPALFAERHTLPVIASKAQQSKSPSAMAVTQGSYSRSPCLSGKSLTQPSSGRRMYCLRMNPRTEKVGACASHSRGPPGHRPVSTRLLPRRPALDRGTIRASAASVRCMRWLAFQAFCSLSDTFARKPK